MKNKSVSDFVAATMDAVLRSEEHKSLFNPRYKFASDENATCDHVKDESCDKCADDNDAKKSKLPPWLKDKSKDESCADDCSHVNDADHSHADDGSLSPSVAFDVAIDSLLTASAALDAVGLTKGSALSLKLASLVVEAKAKDPNKEKEKAKAKAAKEKEKKDLQAAKDKAAKAKAKEKEKAAKDKEKEKHDTQMAKDKAVKDKDKAKAQAEKEKAAKEKAKVFEKKSK